MAAAAVLLGSAIIGSGVDMSRAYKAKNRLQAACDSAVLAGRRAVSTTGFDDNAESQANAFFNTNFAENSYEARNTVFEAYSDDEGATVNGIATTTVDTAIMQIFGFETFDFSVDCSASMGVGNSDVVMVLDTTGSMGSTLSGTSDTRLEALQDAMENFYDTLKQATSGTNARIRYGFVPYSQSVNVGGLIRGVNPDYIVDAYPYQSRQPVWRIETEEVFDSWDDPVESTDTEYDDYDYGSWDFYSYTDYRKSKDCEDALPNDTDWQNYGPPSYGSPVVYTNSRGQRVERTTKTQRQRMTDYECWKADKKEYYRIWRYVYRDFNSHTYATSDPVYTTVEKAVFDKWEYKQITRDVSEYKAFKPVSLLIGNTGWDGEPTNVTSTWDGCIEERATVSESTFSFSSLLGITPSGAKDLDIDAAPSLWDDSTKWAPMWPEVAYRRWNSYGSYTNDTTNDGSQASSSCPVAARLLSEMSESAFDAYAASLSARGNTYLDIGMLWGARLSSPTGIFADSVNSEPTNGAEVARHIIFMTDGIMQPSSTIQSAYGIERHDKRVTDNGYSYQDDRHTSRFLALCKATKAKGIRIWVIAFTTGLSSDLTTCASDNSSFTADDAGELDEAFQEIAKQVGELRIIQ